MLNLGLDALDNPVAIVILHREVEGGYRAVALHAYIDLVNDVGHAVGDSTVTHLEGVAARLEECRVR